MERGYAGGHFLAVDLAQRIILVMQDSPALKHVLHHECKRPLLFTFLHFEHRMPPSEPCPAAANGLCFAVNRNDDAVIQPAAPNSDAGEAGRLARDVARYLALYVKKRPSTVHAFYAHECRDAKRPRQQVWEKCVACNWKPKEWARCDYCQMGACTTCVSEASYRPCGQGCCRLCVSCYPLIANETCDVPGCTQLRCGRQQARRCEDKQCWKRLCMMHAQRGKHECEQKGVKTSAK